MSQVGHTIKMKVMGIAIKYLPFPEPKVHVGAGKVSEMGAIVKMYGLRKPLIVTDEMLVSLGHVKTCTDSLEAEGIGFAIYDKVLPNPTIEMVDAGYGMYKDNGCDGIIAFGGGSPMDCAKVIGCKVCDPKPFHDYCGGLDKVKDKTKYPPLLAIPTTAGTGSETTLAAVITDKQERKKYFVAGTVIIPKAAVLDPKILVGLPKAVTAATGIDALTHAVESYISSIAFPYTKMLSLRAVERIFRSLKKCYDSDDDLAAKEDMLLGAFEAGAAFTKAQLGYVHCIAHQFGGLYGTPHGAANAMVLPKVLDFNLKEDQTTATIDKYCELAIAAGIATRYQEYSDAEKKDLAHRFVQAIRDLEADMDMMQHVPELKAEDVHTITDRAIAESLQLAPVPLYMSPQQCDEMVASFLPEGSSAPPPRSRL